MGGMVLPGDTAVRKWGGWQEHGRPFLDTPLVSSSTNQVLPPDEVRLLQQSR